MAWVRGGDSVVGDADGAVGLGVVGGVLRGLVGVVGGVGSSVAGGVGSSGGLGVSGGDSVVGEAGGAIALGVACVALRGVVGGVETAALGVEGGGTKEEVGALLPLLPFCCSSFPVSGAPKCKSKAAFKLRE